MTWFKVDDKLAFHRKVLAAGNAAIGAWVRMGAQCAAHLSDGFISDAEAQAIAPSGAEIDALVRVKLLERVEGGYQLHDYLAYNPSADEVEDKRAEISRVRSEAGRKGGQRSGERRKELSAGVSQSVKQAARQALTRALARGDMVRKPCERCGDPESEGHHEDYSRALEVVWLCRRHHDERHFGAKQNEPSCFEANEAKRSPVPSRPDPVPGERETRAGARPPDGVLPKVAHTGADPPPTPDESRTELIPVSPGPSRVEPVELAAARAVEPAELERLAELYETAMREALGGRPWGLPRRERWILAALAVTYGGPERPGRLAWLPGAVAAFVRAAEGDEIGFGSGFPRALERWLASGSPAKTGRPFRRDPKQSLPEGRDLNAADALFDAGETDGDKLLATVGMK